MLACLLLAGTDLEVPVSNRDLEVPVSNRDTPRKQ
jgi:hypothetical protein